MGKKEELWDDSALLKAFDDAMSNYKKMHAKKTEDISTDGEAVCPYVAEEVQGPVRDAEENKNKVTSNSQKNFEETKNLEPDQEYHFETCMDSSGGLHKQAVNDYSYSQNLERYNQLLNQYYKLEEKRQMILHELQQFGGYDYQTSAEGFGSSRQLGTCYTSHDHSFPTSQPSVSTVVCSCCPCACHCSVATCTSFPCYSKTCDDSCALTCHEKSSLPSDGDIVKTAMEAAEKAISSIKIGSANCGTEGKGKDNVEVIAQCMSSETDLSLVLNAWYSAGFYTGKYLTEQSKKGK